MLSLSQDAAPEEPGTAPRQKKMTLAQRRLGAMDGMTLQSTLPLAVPSTTLNTSSQRRSSRDSNASGGAGSAIIKGLKGQDQRRGSTASSCSQASGGKMSATFRGKRILSNASTVFSAFVNAGASQGQPTAADSGAEFSDGFESGFCSDGQWSDAAEGGEASTQAQGVNGISSGSCTEEHCCHSDGCDSLSNFKPAERVPAVLEPEAESGSESDSESEEDEEEADWVAPLPVVKVQPAEEAGDDIESFLESLDSRPTQLCVSMKGHYARIKGDVVMLVPHSVGKKHHVDFFEVDVDDLPEGHLQAGTCIRAFPEDVTFEDNIWVFLPVHCGCDRILRSVDHKNGRRSWEVLENPMIKAGYAVVGVNHFCDLVATTCQSSGMLPICCEAYLHPDKTHLKVLSYHAAGTGCAQCKHESRLEAQKLIMEGYARPLEGRVQFRCHRQRDVLCITVGGMEWHLDLFPEQFPQVRCLRVDPSSFREVDDVFVRVNRMAQPSYIEQFTFSLSGYMPPVPQMPILNRLVFDVGHDATMTFRVSGNDTSARKLTGPNLGAFLSKHLSKKYKVREDRWYREVAGLTPGVVMQLREIHQALIEVTLDSPSVHWQDAARKLETELKSIMATNFGKTRSIGHLHIDEVVIEEAPAPSTQWTLSTAPGGRDRISNRSRKGAARQQAAQAAVAAQQAAAAQAAEEAQARLQDAEREAARRAVPCFSVEIPPEVVVKNTFISVIDIEALDAATAGNASYRSRSAPNCGKRRHSCSSDHSAAASTTASTPIHGELSPSRRESLEANLE
eukprot:TRINITY_DN18988_c0_g1_i1.p1 TRINITY_DN18988_c0_g1~~TRINITY_DN18988_c0_g1_i1.p1  ORF type:complete len:791 (-),score=188.26 TRINITY_DN18988_c0_g1_i1:275-2647(-)